MGQSLSGQTARARRHSWTKGLDLPNSDRLDGAELNRRFNSAAYFVRGSDSFMPLVH